MLPTRPTSTRSWPCVRAPIHYWVSEFSPRSPSRAKIVHMGRAQDT
jgi:hypothetical protein